MSTDLRERRIRNIIDATSFREPERVPIGTEIITWAFSYAGVTYKEVMDDPVRTAAAFTKIYDDVEVDCLYSPGISFPVKALQTLGVMHYTLSSDDTCLVNNQTIMKFMEAGEYPQMTADPRGFQVETFVRRNVPAFGLEKKEAYAKLVEALQAFKPFYLANQMIINNLVEDRQLLPFGGSKLPNFEGPFSLLFNSLRGIRDSLVDLKRRPEAVREAVTAIWEQSKTKFRLDPKDFTSPYPFGRTSYHPECFLSPSWYDELYFSQFKEACLPFMEAGMKFYLKGEGRFLNTVDRFRQLPRGSMLICVDEDDPFEVHKAIGDWQSIAAGITIDLIQNGTKQQCIDYVRKSFDTFAPGGGFVFMINKPLLCPRDVKLENFFAVYETANELAG